MEVFLSVVAVVVLVGGYLWWGAKRGRQYAQEVYENVVLMMQDTEDEPTIRAFTGSTGFAVIAKYSMGRLTREQATIEALELFQREADRWREIGSKYPRSHT